ncbi:HAD hydrolase-like protein [Citricoccus sp.]|uniref:HAD hydrolase-like protein n=1 Tax=Citricoccus sp. TaxID=1978372 RepID=UPI0028BF2102|nr:HAD hydrolase-like protein [Citricoccus sp.]
MTAPGTAILFDLDGTLVDPAGAITGGIAAALERHGLPVPGPDRLASLVGPPLQESLASLEGVTAENMPAVIRDYRAGYLSHGMAASSVYPGVRDALEDLGAGHRLVVATSKPRSLARQLLRVQGLDHLFAAVCGSNDDETAPLPPHGTKVQAMAEALAAVGHPERAVMVGDRHFDLAGAAHHGIPGIGVLWGFGSRSELAGAGATVLCENAGDLPEHCRALVTAARI